MNDSDAPQIAIVGLSGRFPGAPDLAIFWRNLRAGVESIAFLDDEELAWAGVEPELSGHPDYVRAGGFLDDVERFDAELFGFSPREAEILDPQHRLFLESAWAALEDAGCDPRRFDGRIGVYAGAGMPLYLLEHIYPNHELVASVGAYQAALANDKDFLATRASYKLGLTGPSLAVQTACSTSLVAVALACQSLADGDCDAALAGGVSLRLPLGAGYLYQEEGILSPDGHCRAFDAAARGTVPGSGVGVVALKRLEDAVADGDAVRAVIRGWALNNDGADKLGFTAPRAEGQAEAIYEAMALAAVHPETVSYVEAHGTGTRLGDPIEVAGLKRAFAAARRPESCGLGSVKTNIGHLDAAAGVAGLIKTVLALEHRELPPSLHFSAPNPELGLASSPFYVVDSLRPWEAGETPRRAGVSSFGIGGTNAHVVLEEAPAPPARRSDSAREWSLLALSAGTEEALTGLGERLAGRFAEDPGLDPGDAAYTLGTGRRRLAERRAVVVGDAADAASTLAGLPAARVAAGVAGEARRPVAFLLPGQGAQYPGMTGGLYASQGVFRSALDRCAGILAPHLGEDLRAILFPAVGSDPETAAARLTDTRFAQPAIVAVSWALAELWRSWGVEPEAMAGHSIGELTAACLAGVMSLDDALALVALRGRLLAELPPGAMLSVPLAEAEVGPLLGDALSLAAVNGAELCAVSGPEEAIAELAARLAERGVTCRRLHTSHAFHSAAVEPALAPFRRAVEAVSLAPPGIPFVSSVTGDWIRPEEATDPEHWVRQLRRPVRFGPALEALLAEPRRALLEVGPGEMLSTLARRLPAASEATVVASVRHPDDPSPDEVVLLRAAGRLWAAGVEVADEVFHPAGARKVALPTYPFGGARYWVERTAPGEAPAATPSGLVPKRTDPAEWFYLPSWKRVLAAAHRPPAGATEDGEGQEDRPWLVFLGAAELGERLVARLRAAGRRVLTVTAGDAFAETGPGAYRLRPAVEADYEELLAALAAADATPGRIVQLWGVRGADSAPGEAAARVADEPAFAGLLLLARALGRHLHNEPVRIVTVVDRLYTVTGGEARAPERAAAVGLARVVAQEYPNLLCRALDIEWNDDEATTERELDLLAAELAADSTRPLTALRGGHLWEQVFEPLPLAAPAAGDAPLTQGGHVLITGGLGRLGEMLGRHLAAGHRARLTLIDRAAAEGLPGWVDELRAAGVEALVLDADVTDPEALARAVAAGVERFGPPDGVIHAAGAPAVAYATLAELDLAACEEHLAPKLRGAEALARALAETGGPPPAWGLVASSLSAVLGGIGLGAFAAADATADAFAEAAAGGAVPWLSVNFEGWQSFELAGGAGVLGQQQNELVMTPEEVADACARALGLGGEPRLAVATGDLGARLAQWTNILAAGAALRRPGSDLSAHRRRSDVPYRAPESEIERHVAALWSEVLGVEEIGLDDDFFLFGGSSLSGLQILSRLRGEYDVELPLKAFFEARTVAGMAERIAAERHRDAEEETRLAELLAEIEAMSSDEVAAEIGGELEEAP